LRNATKLKSESKRGETFTNFPFLKFGDLFGKKRTPQQNVPFFIFIFRISPKFSGENKNTEGHGSCCQMNIK